jgi:phosphoserine phosphatase
MSPRDARRSAPDVSTLERILEITRQLAAPFDLQTLLAEVIDAGRAVLSADRGTVFLYDPRTDELIVSVATGMAPIRMPADRGIAGECARTRSVVNVPDCYADPRFNPEVDKKSGYRTRCLLTVPLIGYDETLVGVLQLLNKAGGVFDEVDEGIAATLAAQCAVAIQRAQMTEQLLIKEKQDRELALAREIQIGFLPKQMPQLRGYDMAGVSRPADETGGDTFDLVTADGDRVVLLLGDATGHGIGPALSVTQLRAMLCIAQRLGADLDTTTAQINDQLEQDLASNRFITAFLGVLDATSHRVTYHSAGQGPLLHFHAATGECEWRGSTTMPLGLMPTLVMEPPATFQLEPGDILGLMTDGIFEYENGDGEAFGQQGVASVVREHHDEPMTKLIERLLQAVRHFAPGQPQADDMTIVLVRRRPE